MACKDYENRPQLCRDVTCGKLCEHCGQCCHNALLGLTFQEGVDMDEDMIRFFHLHGIHLVEQGFFFECCCKNFIVGADSG